MRRLPRQATPPGNGLIDEQLRQRLDGDTQLAPAVDALRPPQDVQADLLELATEFARQFVIYGRRDPIGMLHAVTAPVAARSVLGLVPAPVARDTYTRLWQAGAALVSVYSSGAAAEALPASAPPSLDDLTDRAVRTGDPHAIKLTEASLRLHAERAEPILLHAAARASELLGIAVSQRAAVADFHDAAQAVQDVRRSVRHPAGLLRRTRERGHWPPAPTGPPGRSRPARGRRPRRTSGPARFRLTTSPGPRRGRTPRPPRRPVPPW